VSDLLIIITTVLFLRSLKLLSLGLVSFLFVKVETLFQSYFES
jgi:hypothetical protein